MNIVCLKIQEAVEEVFVQNQDSNGKEVIKSSMNPKIYLPNIF